MRLFVVFSPLSRTLQSVAPGSPPDDSVRGLWPCSTPPRMLQSGASFCRILSVASDAPVRCTGFTPGQSSPGASAVPHSAPDAPIRGVILSYSLRGLGCSSPWHLVHPLTIQSGGLCRASFRPGCSNPGRLFIVFSPLPRTLQSVALGSPPDDPVRGLGPCSTPPRMLLSGASFCRILSVASDAPLRGTGFSPGRFSPGARAELHSAPDAPIRGVMHPTLFAVFGSTTPQRALWRAGFARSGGGTRVPEGAPPAWVWGVRGWALSHPRPLVLSGVPQGPAARWPWVRCAGVGARLSLAPCPVPWFVVCCARIPGSRHAMAVVAWHLSLCRGCGRWRASLACLVAPRRCAAPRPVRSLSVLRSAFPSPWCLPPPRKPSPPALLGGCAGHVEAGREPGSLCLPLAPAEARALGALCVVPVRGPAMGLSLAGPSGSGLGLRALRWFGVCGPGH